MEAKKYEPPAPKFHVSGAGPALLERAQKLYVAYTENAHNLNYQGLPCPPWDELGESVQSHWCAAAAASTTEGYLGGRPLSAMR